MSAGVDGRFGGGWKSDAYEISMGQMVQRGPPRLSTHLSRCGLAFHTFVSGLNETPARIVRCSMVLQRCLRQRTSDLAFLRRDVVKKQATCRVGCGVTLMVVSAAPRLCTFEINSTNSFSPAACVWRIVAHAPAQSPVGRKTDCSQTPSGSLARGGLLQPESISVTAKALERFSRPRPNPVARTLRFLLERGGRETATVPAFESSISFRHRPGDFFFFFFLFLGDHLGRQTYTPDRRLPIPSDAPIERFAHSERRASTEAPTPTKNNPRSTSRTRMTISRWHRHSLVWASEIKRPRRRQFKATFPGMGLNLKGFIENACRSRDR